MKQIRPIWILLVGWLFALAYAFPGYMNFDSADQLRQARAHAYTDWHPPMMAWYWRIIEKAFHGPLPLLLLQLTLFLWGVYGILCRRFTPRVAAIIACLILLFPPVLTPMAVVWKDAQMAAWLIAGTMLALRETPRTRAIGLVLLVLACGVRDNACTALPPLLLFIVASWGVRRKLVVCAVAFGLFVAIAGGAVVANKLLTVRPGYAWYCANAIHDIAGTICNADPMTDEQVKAELVGIPLVGDQTNLQARFCKQYTPRWWIPLSINDNALFDASPKEDDRIARKAAYFRLVGDHTSAFLKHRWLVIKELLGLTPDGAEEPVCQSFAGAPGQLVALHHDASMTRYQIKLGRWFRKMAGTVFYQPWAYLVVAFILFVYALWTRKTLVLALLGSGILYETSFLLGAAGPAYRYSHWMVLCTCLAAVITMRERARPAPV
jgi:hypothetical protein